MNISVNDDGRRRKIERALNKFSQNWTGLDDHRRSSAIKVMILCELLGGRTRVVSLLDLKDNTLDNYRHGKTEPRTSTLKAMAELAGVPVEFLGYDWSFEDGEIRFGAPDPSYGSFAEAQVPFVALGQSAAPYVDMPDRLIVPGYDEVQGGRQEHSVPVTFPQSFFARIDVDPANLRVLSAAGDSMSPTIVDGAPLLVDITDHKLQDGRIYAFDLGGERLIRRVQRQANGSLELLADNETRYRSQSVEQERIADMKIIGRVCAGTWIL